MIPVNGLRIGSLVLYNNAYNIVSGIIPPCPNSDKRWDGKWVIEINPPDCFNVTIDEINPIPLTPEILERAGFEKSYVLGSQTNFVYTKGVLSYNESHGGWWFRGPFTDIPHLHQLQNLYFAMTGEELNIEL